ncbi:MULTISPECIES: toxin [unclassified Streptomyces]|uniref:toxin n=1 Tax=unclassified Streptomyces TaxID=2593676 RepID=UPI003D71BB9E
MSTKAMKALLASLGKEASRSLERPAEPKTVMQEFCRAMSIRQNRPVQLAFRAFPDDLPVSGMRLDCGDQSLIVVEDRAVPESQLVILGHELWHEEQGDCNPHVTGVPTAARALSDNSAEALQKAAKQILSAQDVPRDALLAVAARADSHDDHEADAETFGLLFGREIRTWITGRYAKGPVTPSTVEGRIDLSLSNRSGQILG